MFKDKVSATEPDWSREELENFWEPGRQLIKTIRQYNQWRSKSGLLSQLYCKILVLQHRFWSVVTASEIPINCQFLGGGLVLRHPNGIVMSPTVKIGCNCMIFQQVTIVGGVTIGGHVDIGAGAKIIRPVTIGDHVQIGANAVVISDIPSGATAVGVPAKVIVKDQ